MPLLDMPLEQLKNYRGINPRPVDFDEFWDKSLAEMHAVDPKLQMTKSSFQAPGAQCFDMYFTGVRGARIYAQFLKPANAAKPMPAVLQFHGYSSQSGDWSDKLKWVQAGFAVAALDCRGQGGKSQDCGGTLGNTYQGHIIRGLDDKAENMLFRHIFLDTAQLAGIVMNMPEIDPARVGAYGGSQGGGLTLACVSLEPRIKRATPQYPFLCDYKRVWEMDLAKDAYVEIKTYLRQFDPTHSRIDEMWNKLGYIDCQHLAPRIKSEILFGVGLMDNICPPSTQFAAYNKITSKKDMIIYPDFGHECLPWFSDRTYEFLMGL